MSSAAGRDPAARIQDNSLAAVACRFSEQKPSVRRHEKRTPPSQVEPAQTELPKTADNNPLLLLCCRPRTLESAAGRKNQLTLIRDTNSVSKRAPELAFTRGSTRVVL